MGNLTREQILARKLGRGTGTLRDGSTVAIRALTRNEVFEMQKREDPADRDNYVVSCGMTDPKLSEEDVAAWGDSGDAGDLVDLTDQIGALSGLKEGAGKAANKSPRRRSRS